MGHYIIVNEAADLRYAALHDPWTQQISVSDAAHLTDADCVHFSAFSGLRDLVLRGSAISDDGLAPLAGLTALERLDLAGMRITGNALKHLAGLVKLESLILSLTDVDDASLAHLKALKALASLHLSGTLVTDSGLTHLRPLDNITELILDLLRVTNQGLQHVQALKKLLVLSVRRTAINDIALAVIGQMTTLVDLDVSGNQSVTITGVNRYLKALTNLSRFVTRGTAVTPGQRKQFETDIGRTLTA